MAFFLTWVNKSSIVEVGDAFLAAHFIVASRTTKNPYKIVETVIKTMNRKPQLILKSPDNEEVFENNPEDVNRWIKDSDYIYVGIELPRKNPVVVWKIKGNIELFHKIADQFGQQDKGIEECPPRAVDKERDFLIGEALNKVRQWYRNGGHPEIKEPVEIAG